MDVCRVTRPAPVPTRPGPLGQLLGYLRLDVAAGPVARVRLPQRVPLGFHATWVRADQLRRNET